MNILETVLSLVSVIGTGVAIYQWAVLNEAKKRRSELQYLLAAIHQIALSKYLEWSNQLNLLPPTQNERDLDIVRLHARARDNLMEISSTVTALEGVIDVHSSAISAMLQKTIDQTQLNNRLQSEGLKNPTLPRNREMVERQVGAPTTGRIVPPETATPGVQ